MQYNLAIACLCKLCISLNESTLKASILRSYDSNPFLHAIIITRAAGELYGRSFVSIFLLSTFVHTMTGNCSQCVSPSRHITRRPEKLVLLSYSNRRQIFLLVFNPPCKARYTFMTKAYTTTYPITSAFFFMNCVCLWKGVTRRKKNLYNSLHNKASLVNLFCYESASRVGNEEKRELNTYINDSLFSTDTNAHNVECGNYIICREPLGCAVYDRYRPMLV